MENPATYLSTLSKCFHGISKDAAAEFLSPENPQLLNAGIKANVLELCELGIAYGNNTHDACMLAARYGRLAILRRLRENGCPWGASTYTIAMLYGHTETAEWAKTAGCPIYSDFDFDYLLDEPESDSDSDSNGSLFAEEA
jgi:hypothetical protein